jgi:hypothetical protein
MPRFLRAPTPPAAPGLQRRHRALAHVADPARELLLRERDRARRRQLLARLSYQDPDLERRRRDAEARLAGKQAGLTPQEGKLRMAAALAAGPLTAAGAVVREDLVQAEAAVAHAGGSWRGSWRRPSRDRDPRAGRGRGPHDPGPRDPRERGYGGAPAPVPHRRPNAGSCKPIAVAIVACAARRRGRCPSSVQPAKWGDTVADGPHQ